jgi:hypothetical protein
MNERKSRIEYEIPKDFNLLGKLLKNIKETERIIRQDENFLYRIRARKPVIQLKTVDNKPEVSRKSEGRSGLSANPIKVPRSGIVLTETKLY